MSEHKSPIPGRIYNAAVGGHVCGTEDIIDDKSELTVQDLVGNKDYNAPSYSGLGRVTLKKNIVNGVNTLTQDMFYKGEIGSRVPNTNIIYVIQYDFTLGENITVPANCVLEFDGGSISNDGSSSYTLSGNKTLIVAPLYKIFNPNVIFGGTRNQAFIAEYSHPEWFGAKVGDDSTAAVQAATDFCGYSTTRMLKLSTMYQMSDTLKVELSKSGIIDITGIEKKTCGFVFSNCSLGCGIDYGYNSTNVWAADNVIIRSFYIQYTGNQTDVDGFLIDTQACTVGGHFEDLYFNNFTGYAIRYREYLQEAAFKSIFAQGCGGLFGYAKEGDIFSLPCANVVSFDHCDMMGVNANTTIRRPFDLYGGANIIINQCVMQGAGQSFMDDSFKMLRIGCPIKGIVADITINGLWLEWTNITKTSYTAVSIDYTSNLVINNAFGIGKIKINKTNVDIHYNVKNDIVNPNELPQFIIADDVNTDKISIYLDTACYGSYMDWNGSNRFTEYLNLMDKGIIREIKNSASAYHNMPACAIFELRSFGINIDGFKSGEILKSTDNARGEHMMLKEEAGFDVIYGKPLATGSNEYFYYYSPENKALPLGISELIYRVKIDESIENPDLTDEDNYGFVAGYGGKTGESFIYPNMILSVDENNPHEWSRWKRLRYLGGDRYNRIVVGRNVIIEVAASSWSNSVHNDRTYTFTETTDGNGNTTSSLTFIADRRINIAPKMNYGPTIDSNIVREFTCMDIYGNTKKAISLNGKLLDFRYTNCLANGNVAIAYGFLPPADKCAGITFYLTDRKKIVLSNGTDFVNTDGTPLT